MSDWTTATDPTSGREYYYNRVTKVTSWTKPDELKVAEEGDQASTADPDTVPENWQSTVDPNTKKTYYYNKVTKQTRWTEPDCLVSTTTESAPTTTTPAVPVAKATSDNPWGETVDKTSGRKYWYNKVTKETSWTDPNLKTEAKATAPASAPADGDDSDSGESSVYEVGSSDDDDDSDWDNTAQAATAAEASANANDEAETADEPAEAAEPSNNPQMRKAQMAQRSFRQEMQDETEEDISHKYQLAKHRHGGLHRLFRTGAIIDDEKLLSFKKSQIKKALLKQNRHLDALAVQTFKNIMSYMGDRRSSKKPLDHAKKLLRNLMLAPAGLRDEAYMQLVKQTTKNPNGASIQKGWELMVYFVCCFPPSKNLREFLSDYVDKNINDQTHTESIRALCRTCAENIPKICLMGQRKQVPSEVELIHVIEHKAVPVTVYLADDSNKTYEVDSYTTCNELIQQLCEAYKLVVTSPFALYEAADVRNNERLIDSKERVLDSVANWEYDPLFQEAAKTDKQFSKSTKKKKNKKGLSTEFSKFLFKAKLVLKTSNKQIMSDSEAISLIYLQAVADVVSVRYPSNDKDITVLAALQLQATHGDFKASVHFHGWLKPKITEFMPEHLLMKKNKINEKLASEWEQKILDKYQRVAGFTSLEAKLNYLDYIQEWTFYGCTFFVVEQRQFKNYPSPLILGINCEGAILMHPEKKTVLENYAYTDIVTWGHSDEKFIVVVGNIVQQRKLIFKTLQGQVMNHLIHDYVKYMVQAKRAN